MEAFLVERLYKYSSRVKSGQPVASEVDVDRWNKFVEGERRSQLEAGAVPMELWSFGVTWGRGQVGRGGS